jgi:hypothetical protein
MSEKVWNGTKYVEAEANFQECAADLREMAVAWRAASPSRMFEGIPLYEMTGEIRDALVEVLESAAALIDAAYEDAE